MTADARPAAPFSAWERSIALRYLKARRKTGGVALVSVISFIGIMAAVAVLISVMSIMNGFRAELLDQSSASTATCRSPARCWMSRSATWSSSASAPSPASPRPRP